MDKFILHSAYQPTGDQPQAIEKLAEGVLRGDKEQVLLGVTGSGKTFTMANVIARVNKPTIVLHTQKGPRRATLFGVPRVFPRKCGGVFRIILQVFAQNRNKTPFLSIF